MNELAAERLRAALFSTFGRVRLLLDEMWSPTIALQLRKRDLDVIAITEPAHASRYAGISDDQVFARVNPPFNRHRGERVIGQMVRALAHFLSSADAAKEPFSRAHYLREAPDED